jgi:hypothetical protein
MIDKEKYAYAPTYDLYIHRETMIVYKRCNRRRKTEITEDELIPLNLRVFHNGYFMFYSSLHHNHVGVQYAYADAFPDRVQGWQDHMADFLTYNELDHLHGHDTLESNFPENLRWTSSRVNRARTSKTVDLSTVDEKRKKQLLKRRERQRRYREDKKWLKKKRERDAAYRRRKYAETKEMRKRQTEELNAKIAKLAGVDNAK